jgi:hypothetical protein
MCLPAVTALFVRHRALAPTTSEASTLETVFNAVNCRCTHATSQDMASARTDRHAIGHTHSELQRMDDSWHSMVPLCQLVSGHLEQERKVCRGEASPQDADPRELRPTLRQCPKWICQQAQPLHTRLQGSLVEWQLHLGLVTM